MFNKLQCQLLLLLGILFLQGCSVALRPSEISLKGVVSAPKIYPVSDDALLVVTLSDDRIQDVKNKIIATKIYPWSDNFEVHFFVPSHLNLSDLNVHFSVLENGERLLLSDTSIPADHFGLSPVKLIATNTSKQNLLNQPTSWRLVRVEGKANVSQVTLNLDGNNKLSGHANCNRYFASYQLAAQDFTVERLSNSRSFCPQMKQELTYLKALRRAVSLSINTRDQLVIKDADNKPVLIYRHK